MIEVGVSAGDQSDGFAGGDFVDLSLSISEGDQATDDFQLAEAVFELALIEDSPNSDFDLLFQSDVLAMTNGSGTASALGNAIVVFELTEDFNVNSLAGDSVLFNSLGEAVNLLELEPQLLVAGTYSLSFGASASIQANDTIFLEENSVSGLISFTAVPEPGVSVFSMALLGLFAGRRRHV